MEKPRINSLTSPSQEGYHLNNQGGAAFVGGPGFVLREDLFVKSGSLKYEALRLF